jgi:hypothetical protein
MVTIVPSEIESPIDGTETVTRSIAPLEAASGAEGGGAAVELNDRDILWQSHTVVHPLVSIGGENALPCRSSCQTSDSSQTLCGGQVRSVHCQRGHATLFTPDGHESGRHKADTRHYFYTHTESKCMKTATRQTRRDDLAHHIHRC